MENSFKQFTSEEIAKAIEWAKSLNDDEFMYVLELESEWKRKKSFVYEGDLLKEVSDNKGLIIAQIKEWEEKLLLAKLVIRQKIFTVKATYKDEFERWYWLKAIAVQEEGRELELCKSNLKRLKGLLISLSKPKKSSRGVNEEEINNARSYPILELTRFHMKVRRRGKIWVALCPLQRERSPSFTIYPDSNSFYCFGCQVGGGIIKLTMLLQGCDFITAVQHLTPIHYDK